LRAKVIDVLGETKISNLIDTLVYEDVGWLQVSMNYLLSDELSKATQNLLHNIKDLVFLEFFPFHELLKIPVLAKLSDDVQTIF